jgi:hypothetical protein
MTEHEVKGIEDTLAHRMVKSAHITPCLRH